MKKLLLIDGNAILHRAFHAYPAFTDKEGKIINAIYGFYAMMIKLFEEIKPDYLTICFDRGEPTFRMNMYTGYHANRPKMSDDLAPQVPRLHESLDVLGIPHYGVDGYEADDLIGTLSFEAKEKGLETIIVTGDRDLLQLVNSHVKVLMPITGITKSIIMDERAIEEKYGVKASQFIDYKALVGDQSDGYPGVSGIGPKTASGLLQKFGTLEHLYAHLGEVKEEIAQKLARDAEQCALAKKLATIQLDAPVHLEIDKADIENFTKEKFFKAFIPFGFNSLKKRLEKMDIKEGNINGEVNTTNKNQLELL
ncbi:MAG TPA: 5'-3' exonuclease H3TH domain-containing protein [Patescibacteria group bacterium]